MKISNLIDIASQKYKKTNKIYIFIAAYIFGCILVRYDIDGLAYNLIFEREIKNTPNPEIWSQIGSATFKLLEPIFICLAVWMTLVWCVVLPAMFIWLFVDKIKNR